MTPRITGLAGALAGALLLGCAEDPLGDLDADPAAIVSDITLLTLLPGESRAVTASVVDGRATPLEIPVTFTACDADITVTPDQSYNPVPRTSWRAIVTGGGTADASCLVMSGGGVSDTVYGGVRPATFAGALSSTTPDVGDTLTLNATAALQFDPATADIDFGGGIHGLIVERTAQRLRVIVPQPDSAQPRPLDVSGIVVTYIPGLIVSAPTAQEVTITNPYDPNSAPDPAFVAPVPGEFFDGFVSSTCVNGVGDACDNFYTLSLATQTTFTVRLEWDTEADLDILFCNAGCTAFVGSFAGATGANPEVVQVTLGAGNYNLWINAFDNHDDPAHLYKVTITVP